MAFLFSSKTSQIHTNWPHFHHQEEDHDEPIHVGDDSDGHLNTYRSRVEYFVKTTNPVNLFYTNAQLQQAKKIVSNYRKDAAEHSGITDEEYWKSKYIYDSAYHPDTGEKLFILGRMSAQVPANMLVTGCMLASQTSTPAVAFWIWANRTFNSMVTYCNRNGNASVNNVQVGACYVLSTAGALGVLYGANYIAKTMPALRRFVPFAAVSVGTSISVPTMRMSEIQQGVPIFDDNGHHLGYSKIAAKWGIAKVIATRILMTVPGMVFPPMVMNRVEKTNLLKRLPWMSTPLQVLLCGICFSISTPLACAAFPQHSPIAVRYLEKTLQEKIRAKSGEETPPEIVFYNKGL